MSEGPNDPITSLTEAAGATHEMFLAYTAAGFTEDQALKLIGSMVATIIIAGKESEAQQ